MLQDRRFGCSLRFQLLAWLAATAILIGLPCRAQTPVWRNDWTPLSPPSFLDFGTVPATQMGVGVGVFADTGLLFIATPAAANGDAGITAMQPDGSVLWSARTGFQSTYGANVPTVIAAIGDGSGGAIVSIGDVDFPVSSALARFGASGEVAWILPVPAGPIVRLSDGTVVTASAGGVTSVDVETGVILWQRNLSACRHCQALGLVVDDQDNIYVGFPVFDSNLPLGAHASRLGPDGSLAWDSLIDDVAVATPAGIAAGTVFFNEDDRAAALDSDTGAGRWSVDEARIAAMAGDPAEPVVVASHVSLSRLAADDGQPRWSIPYDVNAVTYVTSALGAVIVGSWDTLTSLDPDSGAQRWSAPLPADDAEGNALTFLTVAAADAGALVAVAGSSNGNSGAAPPVFLQTLNATTGQPGTGASAAPVVQGVSSDGSALLDGVGDMVDVAVIADPTATRLALRRVDVQTGLTTWETFQSIATEAPGPLPGNGIGTAYRDGVIVCTIALTTWVEPAGAVWIGAFADSDGTLLWQTVLHDASQGFTSVAAPAMDSSGNVYVAYGTSFGGQFPTSLQTMAKLAAADGGLEWRHDTVGVAASGNAEVDPQKFVLVGDDVVLGGPFSGEIAGDDIAELAGADGGVLWANDVFGGIPAYRFDNLSNGNVRVAGVSGWGEIDAATGTVLWLNPYTPLDCTRACYSYDSVAMPNGDTYSVGEGDFSANISLQPGSAGAVEQWWDIGGGATGFRSFASRIRSDDSGRLWMSLVREFLSSSSMQIRLLSQFDTSTGTLVSNQAIDSFDYSVATDALLPSLLVAPQDGRLSTVTYPTNAPHPLTLGNAVIDTTIAATGNLVSSTTIDQHAVSDGATLVFHAAATYAGDAPIIDAHMVVYLPWPSKPTALTCQAGAANHCAIESHSQVVRVSFDAAPGETVTVSGNERITSSGSDSMPIESMVYGPAALDEMVIDDNFSRAVATQSLFENGFD